MDKSKEKRRARKKQGEAGKRVVKRQTMRGEKRDKESKQRDQDRRGRGRENYDFCAFLIPVPLKRREMVSSVVLLFSYRGISAEPRILLCMAFFILDS